MQLTDNIVESFRLVETQKKALKKLGLITIQDLLFHFPSRYENISQIKPIANLEKGDAAIIYGKISGLATKKSFRNKKPISEGYIEDSTGKIKIIWFHQPYIAKMIKGYSSVKLAGKVTGNERSLYIANPEIENIGTLPIETPDSLFKKNKTSSDNKNSPTSCFYPIYPETRGITSKWFYHTMQKMFNGKILETTKETIPAQILKKYHLPSLSSALVWIHAPKKEKDSVSARKRFAFEEVFFIQLVKQKERREHDEKSSFKIPVDKKKIDEFIKRFPFDPTRAQKKSINAILHDFETTHAMSRLLEGDVGSGKTAVAATTVYAITTTRPMKQDSSEERQDYGNLQTAYMVPTEILAKQQFESFVELFAHLPINIGLITSSGCKKFPSKVDSSKATSISRAQLLKWVQNGEIPILIGTHALIQKSVKFENLAYVIIDEQHRFGTMQRQKLVRKDEIAPHLLSMTATPIPRTLALTIYGDLDLTILDEMPKGRKPVITEIVLPKEREQTYENIRKSLKEGRQMYVICPRIDEPDEKKATALNVKSVTEEAARLKKEIFPDYEIGILHSKLKPSTKEEIMESFARNDIQILVATSVVEVGVNIPNATTIIIEGAERFGLAQLHQLRGRVLRSTHQAYCYIFTSSQNKSMPERLKALRKAKNGFELAEHDLTLRGAGELYGRRQWGLSDMAMEAIKNVKMVEAARHEAHELIDSDPKLQKHSYIKKRIEEKSQTLHFE